MVYVLSAGPYPPPAVLRRLQGRGIPIVANQNGVYYPGWYAGDWEAENRRMAEPYLLADHVFYQSEFCKRSAERFLGTRDGPGEVLYNAVETRLFRPQNRSRDDKAPFVFLVAGKVPAQQTYRLEAAVRGLAEARKNGLDACLIIAGVIDRSARAAAEAVAEAVDVGPLVTFSGPYAQAAAPALFGAADAFLLTTHNDACQTAVIEAMACGTPVAALDYGAVSELVDNGVTGCLSTSLDALVASLPRVEALDRPSVRARAVKRFGPDQAVDAHVELYERLITESLAHHERTAR